MPDQSSVESVIFVCRAENSRLRQLVLELENAEPRRLEGILRALAKTGDTLSSALARVSAYVDCLEGETPDGPQDAPPPHDPGLLDVVRRLKVGATFGTCPVCKGVRAASGHERAHLDEPDDHAKTRAHRAEEARR